MEDLFDKEFLRELGYEVTKDDGTYGHAESIRNSAKKTIQWNRKGTNINYNGERIEFGQFMGIKDDWGTRTCFNGIVRTREQVALFIELTY